MDKEKKYPCVKIEKNDRRQNEQSNLKDLARQLASRKLDLSSNPAIKRLEKRFRKL